MAQIIKHRRGSIGALKDVVANVGELVIANGSIGDLNAPVLFIGHTAIAGGYKPASKIYQGTNVPSVSSGYGSTMDGVPFYSSNSQSLFILDHTNNINMDLTGNIEGNVISGVTINALTASFVSASANMSAINITASFFTGSFKGDGTNIFNVPASGVTGLNLSRIASGSYTASISENGGFQVNTDVSITGSLSLTGSTYVTGTIYIGDNTVAQIYKDGELFIQDHDGGVNIVSDYYAQLQSGNGFVWVENNSAHMEGTDIFITGSNSTYIGQDGDNAHFSTTANQASIYGANYIGIISDGNMNLYTNGGDMNLSSYDGHTLYLNSDGGEGDIWVLNGSNKININGITNMTGALYLNDVNSTFSIVGNSFSQTTLQSPDGALLLQGGYGGVQINGSNPDLTVNGQTYLKSNLNVTGSSNLTGSVNISGATSVTGSLKVTDDVTFEKDLYVSGNIYQTGSFYTQGNIVLSGSINIGNSLTGDTINFGGEVNSHILPTTGATYDLGSSGQTWNNVYAEHYYGDGSHLTNISLTGITGLNKIIDGPVSASILEVGGFQVNTDSAFTGSVSIADYNTLYTNEIYGNDNSYLDIAADGNIWINTYSSYAYFEVNEGDAGLYVTNNGDQTEFYNYSGDIGVRSYNNNTYIGGQNTYLESYAGTLYLNNDSNNDININGDSYFSTSRTMYVSNMKDNNNNVNYLQLYGSNTDDGYWWESGTGRDTTLFNDESSNVNILARSGKVNIDASDTLSIHTNNGVQITGSLVVSDASGVFNSSLVVNNSDLTLDGGSNIHMNDGAHLYFDTCVDMYYDNGSNNFVFYNDCNIFEFQNNVQFNDNINVNSSLYVQNNAYLSSSLYVANDLKVTGSAYFDSSVNLENGNTLYTNYIYGYDDGDLNIASWGGVYINSDYSRYVEIKSNNDESGTNYVKVQQSGISLETYDYTSTLTHKVTLDNTGSLRFENVAIGITGSLDISGSLDVQGVTHIHNDLYVSGNLTILGSGTTVHISSSQVDLGTNIINLNTYAPFERFAGISVYDSGSNAGVTGSLLWDSTNNVWIYVNPVGSSYKSARFISGPENTGSIGNETGLTNGHFPIATGDDHISDSLLTYQGTTLALNTNKFTVDSETGDTLVHGNFTIEASGATDNGLLSSYIVFRNDENVLGFVDTTDTETESDALLGYNTSTGVLQFSSLIDGGTY